MRRLSSCFSAFGNGSTTPGSNSFEFDGIRNEAGRNSFFPSAKQWIGLTGGKGLIASVGRYGGAYARKDIAFEFGSWLSPEFKLYPFKEFPGNHDQLEFWKAARMCSVRSPGRDIIDKVKP